MNAVVQQSQSAPEAAPLHYERYRPEQTTLYRLVQQHAASFIVHTEAKLPRFIKDEFDALLECGILAHGFLRLRSGECGQDKLLAFSCKRRGFCPSCGARRMSQTAAHLAAMILSEPAPQFGQCCMSMSKTRWSSRAQLMRCGRAWTVSTWHNGRRTLILVSDNNFSQVQFTQFIALEVTGPIPEPQTYALLLAGLLGVGWVARRQRR